MQVRYFARRLKKISIFFELLKSFDVKISQSYPEIIETLMNKHKLIFLTFCDTRYTLLIHTIHPIKKKTLKWRWISNELHYHFIFQPSFAFYTVIWLARAFSVKWQFLAFLVENPQRRKFPWKKGFICVQRETTE